MVGILILEKVEQAFCEECGDPWSVGVFRLFNWHYKFRLCDRCLEKFRNRVVQEGHVLLRKEVI